MHHQHHHHHHQQQQQRRQQRQRQRQQQHERARERVRSRWGGAPVTVHTKDAICLPARAGGVFASSGIAPRARSDATTSWIMNTPARATARATATRLRFRVLKLPPNFCRNPMDDASPLGRSYLHQFTDGRSHKRRDFGRSVCMVGFMLQPSCRVQTRSS